MTKLSQEDLLRIVAELQRQGMVVRVTRASAGAGFFTGVAAGTYVIPANLTVDAKGRIVSIAEGGGVSDIQVEDEGALVATRSTLNFTGGGVTASDDPANDRAVIAIPNTSAVIGFGANSVTNSTTTRYLCPWFEDAIAETAGATNARITVPRAGTLRNMYIRHGNPLGNGNDIVYTLRVNAVASLLTATLASTGGTVSDLVNTVAVVAGDTIDVEVTKALGIGSSPTNITATMELAA